MQLQATLEAAVGFSTDPIFGPIVTVGSGGALVEILDDAEAGLAPLTPDSAGAMIERTRFATIAAGYRNLVAPTPLEEVSKAVVALSWLAADFGTLLIEGDLNPVLVEPGTGRVSIVDVLLVGQARG